MLVRVLLRPRRWQPWQRWRFQTNKSARAESHHVACTQLPQHQVVRRRRSMQGMITGVAMLPVQHILTPLLPNRLRIAHCRRRYPSGKQHRCAYIAT